jgi:hypothetical protein
MHLWRLSKKDAQRAKSELRLTGSFDALEGLLRHSIAYGHQRLVVHRYLLGEALGLPRLATYTGFFDAAASRLAPGELQTAREAAATRATQIKQSRRQTSAMGWEP